MSAKGQETGLIALDQGLEGAVLATTDERDETVVALQPEEGRASREHRPARRDALRRVLKS